MELVYLGKLEFNPKDSRKDNPIHGHLESQLEFQSKGLLKLKRLEALLGFLDKGLSLGQILEEEALKEMTPVLIIQGLLHQAPLGFLDQRSLHQLDLFLIGG